MPWNNNNAENAIKRFALYRAHASGMMKESGVADFLTLLSLRQTCKCKNLSFWRFLMSRQQFDDSYVESKRPPRAKALEFYPDDYVTVWDRLRGSDGTAADKMSGTDAAAQVLEESQRAMTAEELLAEILARGHWTTQSRSPARSLNNAMLREVHRKGALARFQRVGKEWASTCKSH